LRVEHKEKGGNSRFVTIQRLQRSCGFFRMDEGELLHFGLPHHADFALFQKEELDDRLLNIFQAMIMNRKERVDQLLSTDSPDYVLHVKAKDELGRSITIFFSLSLSV
jgi:hypothetical protein